GALLEVQREERLQSGAARMREGFGEVDLFGVRGCDGPAVDGAVQGLRGALAEPAAGDEALEGVVRHVGPVLKLRTEYRAASRADKPQRLFTMRASLKNTSVLSITPVNADAPRPYADSGTSVAVCTAWSPGTCPVTRKPVSLLRTDGSAG